jgi:aspartyl aminopeptidase
MSVSHRYSSESVSEALFADWCEQAEVPYQRYSHRSDLPCGSTIGPIASAKLGIRAVDVGHPMGPCTAFGKVPAYWIMIT